MKNSKRIGLSIILGIMSVILGIAVVNYAQAEDAKDKEEESKATSQTKEEYQIPEGEAYIYGSSDTKYSNDEKGSAISKAIESILKSDKSEAIIVVGDGTYEGGIEIDYKKDSPLKLSIVAQDSFEKVENSDDDTCIPTETKQVDGKSVTTHVYKASSEGGVILLGGIETKNVSLTIAGIHLGNTLKESIEDVGSQDISVTGGASFTYYGTSISDKVSIELTHVSDKITIDMGDGDDTCEFKLIKAPTKTYSYKSVYNDITSDDWINDITNTIQSTLSSIENPGDQEIVITGGDGNDSISSTIMNASDITIDDNNGLSLLMDITPAKLKIESGDGADRISVSGGISMNSFKTIALQSVYNALYSSTLEYNSLITVDSGAGDDYIEVSSTASYISYGTASIKISGGDGYDHVNIDGKIGSKNALEKAIRGTYRGLKLATMAEISIFDSATLAKIYSHMEVSIDSEAITDTLSGKSSVSVTQKENTLYDSSTNLPIAIESFTDYEIEDYDKDKSITLSSGTDAIFANLIISGGDALTIGNIDAPYLTILASAEDTGINSDISFDIDGTINAKNFIIRMENSDSHSLSVVSSDLDSDSDTEIEASCFDVSSSLSVYILSTSIITTSGVFDVLVSSEQTQGLLPTASGLSAGLIDDDGTNPNFIVVKTADVKVEIKGTITSASVRVEASSNVETESQNQALKDFGVPVAVGVVCTNANITIDSATITSSNGITIIAKSDDSLSVTATTGLLPFTLSTAAVVNKSYIDVIGTSTLSSTTDTVLYASSDIITRTISTGTSDGSKLVSSSKIDTKASGGFFTVSVVLADVHSIVSESSSINAGGSLSILSDSLQDIINEATSNPESEGDSKSLADVIDDLKDTFTKAKKNPIFTKKNAQEGLTSIINKLTGEKNGVKNLFESSTSGAKEEEEDKKDDSSSSEDKDDDKKKEDKESGEDQLVGALAVTYTDNDNKAVFDTTGSVSVTGTVSVKSNGSVSIVTLADGSPVKRTSKASGSDNKEEVEKVEEKKTSATVNGIVTVDACDNGTVTIKNDSEADKEIKEGNSVVIKAEAESGYKIKSFVIKEEGKKDDTPSNVVGKESVEFTTIFDKKATISVTFEEKEIELVCENTDTSLYTLTAYSDSSLETVTAHADKGDTIYVSAKCKGGVTLKNITYKYQKNGATIKGNLEKKNGTYSYTLPKGSYYTVTFSAEVELEELELETKETGNVSGNKIDFYDENRKSISKANVGDKVTLEIVTVEGSYVKKDGIKIGDEVLPVKVEGNTYSTEITIKYMKSTPDYFKVSIEFTSDEKEAQGYTAKKTALGVGINVNVTTYSNVSIVNLRGESINVGGFEVESSTIKHDIKAIAKAGFTAADFGLAGTVSVNVVSSKTTADLSSSKATIEDSSDISLKSTNDSSKIVTIADAGGVEADGTSKDDDGIGVGAAVAVVSLTSNIEAIFDGYQLITIDSNIEANSVYNGVIAATLGFGAGTVGVSASVAVVDYSGYTVAAITSNSFIESNNLSIKTDSENKTETITAAMAGGGVAVNGGVSVAVNENTSETFITEGTTVSLTNDLVIENNTDAISNAYLIGASVGAIDVGLSAGVSIVRPVIITYIGNRPDVKNDIETTAKGSITASNIIVGNNVQSNSETTILSLAGGGIAVNGNALLVFNDTESYATVSSMNIYADSLTIDGALVASGNSHLDSIVVGGISVGISASYVGMNYINNAILNYDGITVNVNKLKVAAGDEEKHNVSVATADTLLANSGALSANLNAAITDNNATNSAYVGGKGNITVRRDITVHSYLDAESAAKISGLSGLSPLEASGVSINAGTSIAINRSTNEATLLGDFDLRSISVIASINENKESAKAELYQGQAESVVAVTASVAVAYDQTDNSASFITTKTTARGDIVV